MGGKLAKDPTGPRVVVGTRLPVPVVEWLRARAAEYGTSVSQIVIDIMSEHSGHCQYVEGKKPAPAVPHSQDEELPLMM